MARAEMLELMKELRLIGMPAVYDEVLAQARKRRQSAEAVFEILLEAEAAERRARSIRYRMGQAHFPVQCDLDGFEFDESSVDETQLRTLYEGEFITELRNLIFIGGTGTGKTHLAIAIAMHAVRKGSRIRFFNLVDLANQLEQEKLAGKAGRLAERSPINSSRRSLLARPVGLQNGCVIPNWWCSMSSATCRSLKTPVSSCSICSRSSTSTPRSSSLQTSPSVSGHRCSVTRR